MVQSGPQTQLVTQLGLKHNTVVLAKTWKAALPHMFVWLDFLAIPQMSGIEEDTPVQPDATNADEDSDKADVQPRSPRSSPHPEENEKPPRGARGGSVAAGISQ